MSIGLSARLPGGWVEDPGEQSASDEGGPKGGWPRRAGPPPRLHQMYARPRAEPCAVGTKPSKATAQLSPQPPHSKPSEAMAKFPLSTAAQQAERSDGAAPALNRPGASRAKRWHSDGEVPALNRRGASRAKRWRSRRPTRSRHPNPAGDRRKGALKRDADQGGRARSTER